ncbi:MAG: hypothetical protein JST85_04000 [Acidobacteria bacterium]|nr:hypothetical protein [Acidobacteriota bacterium]
MSQLVFEGTWEEVVCHSSELAGKKVRLTVLEESPDEERAAAAAAIREGMESFQRGEGRPAREALEELKRQF